MLHDIVFIHVHYFKQSVNFKEKLVVYAGPK